MKTQKQFTDLDPSIMTKENDAQIPFPLLMSDVNSESPVHLYMREEICGGYGGGDVWFTVNKAEKSIRRYATFHSYSFGVFGNDFNADDYKKAWDKVAPYHEAIKSILSSCPFIDEQETKVRPATLVELKALFADE